MTDSAGVVRWSADYKPFGEATVTVSTITNNLRFPGQYYDAETENHYNYYRDYNPVTGHYVQADPIGLRGGINPFGYVGNNPINWIDSLGLVMTPGDPLAGCPSGVSCVDPGTYDPNARTTSQPYVPVGEPWPGITRWDVLHRALDGLSNIPFPNTAPFHFNIEKDIDPYMDNLLKNQKKKKQCGE
jgi:RHS repeat-associated protein